MTSFTTFGNTNSAQFVNNIIVQKREINRVTPLDDQNNIAIDFFKAYSYDYSKPVDENFNFSIKQKYLELPFYDKFVLYNERVDNINKTYGILPIDTYKLQLIFDKSLLNADGTDLLDKYNCIINGKEFSLQKLNMGSGVVVTYGIEIPIEPNNTYNIVVNEHSDYFMTPIINKVIYIDNDYINNKKSLIFMNNQYSSYYVLRDVININN